VQTSRHLELLADEGKRLVASVETAGLDTAVPTCPGWQVRDLAQHVGQVHRWATSYVATRRTTARNDEDRPADPPADGALVGWLRAGHQTLVDTLREADRELTCWSFLPAPSPLAFWTRRQAHETAIHRADADSASAAATSYPEDLAVDGVDELLLGFFARPGGRFVSDPAVSLGLRAADTGDAWTVTIGPEQRTIARAAADADCVVTANAADLYLLLWNRRGDDGIDIRGNQAVLQLWRDKAHIK
jgi:uncharacterized protein (TIGR03083 family)